ncbi:MAG TPA: bifunctional methylenetetrahydrofolate dehydrogenase/methenyltetrahydrofolate cyclohydrolase FolD [Gammaproteobacteria bacterium]|jgi:methylenetetrahydrofolate dehydrogenase (NADP+)/methenyltetrahydrofolate cyclohydrolase|nr:bifunctional methylenetetrahydrofolate dehydrogenase/methenyltetrahydrofolate cyclohydrolase FolD [Gammaproteobacteria bacterium]
MPAKLIDGKALANTLKDQFTTIVQQAAKAGRPTPGLAVILVGNDPASEVYVKNKRFTSEQIGIHSTYHHLPTSTQQTDLIALIHQLNHDETINGILLQLPLPKHLDTELILETITPHKDVDGFHPYNLGRLAQRRPLLRPCTPLGIMALLQHIQQPIKGQHAVIIGASNIVGRPMALELLMAGATTTLCHRSTTDLASHVKQGDIIVAATGNPGLIHGDWIKEGATVIDVGITRLANGQLVGDVDFENAAKRAAWITPVPGGVGPMTVAMLMQNTLTAAKLIP